MTRDLFNAVTRRDFPKVQSLLEQGVDLTWTHRQTGRTALSESAIQGHVEIVRTLLDQGVDIDWRDTAMGLTPLGWACQQGHVDTARLLVEAGADINLGSRQFLLSPLMVAVANRRVDLVDLLVAAGADVNAVTADGRNALSMAEQQAHAEVIQRLTAAGAKPPVPMELAPARPWPPEEGDDLHRTPEGVLRAFILAMNQWEVSAWAAHASPAEATAQDPSAIDAIFERHCTPKARPYGRHGSFRHPPEYSLDEVLVDVRTVSPSRAELLTRTGESHPVAEEQLYVVLRKGGRWAVDSKRRRCLGLQDWSAAIL